MNFIRNALNKNRKLIIIGILLIILLPAAVYSATIFVTKVIKAAPTVSLTLVAKDKDGNVISQNENGLSIFKEGEQVTLDAILTTTDSSIEMALITIDYPAEVLSIQYASTPTSQDRSTDTGMHLTTEAYCGVNQNQSDVNNYLSDTWFRGVEVNQTSGKPTGSLRILCGAGSNSVPFMALRPVPKGKNTKIATITFTVKKPTNSSNISFRVNSSDMDASPTLLTGFGCRQKAEACNNDDTCIDKIPECRNNLNTDQTVGITFTTNLSPSITRTASPSITPTIPAISTSPNNKSVRLFPTDDAFVYADQGDKNFGSARNLEVDGSPNKIIYLQYNTGSIDRSKITSAKVVLRITNKSTDVTTVKFSDSIKWKESGITYNNKPDVSKVPVVDSIVGNLSGDDVTINIANQLKNSSGNTFSLVFEQSKSDGLDFYSKEGSVKPYLDIQFEQNTPSANAQIEPTVSGGSNEFIPTADTFVSENNQNATYGTQKTLDIDGRPNSITYIRFNTASIDLSAISSAKLTFYVINKSDSVQNVKISDKLLWSETVVNYKNKPDTTNLPVIKTVNTKGKDEALITVDLTNEIKGLTSNEFTLIFDQTGSDGLTISSREGKSPPKLTITK